MCAFSGKCSKKGINNQRYVSGFGNNLRLMEPRTVPWEAVGIHGGKGN